MFLNIIEILLLLAIGVDIAMIGIKLYKKYKSLIATSPSVKTDNATNIH